MIIARFNEPETILAARTLFITGTDTGVGKTFVSCLILQYLRSRGIDAIGFKPICCGDRDDVFALAKASGLADFDQINPVWFESPLAPSAAAARENRSLDRCAILEGFEALCSTRDRVIVEGAGGWEVPILTTETMADLAVEFAAPVLVVAANRLGAINHTLLTCRAIEERGLTCAGIVLNQVGIPESGDLAAETNREVLELVIPGIPVVAINHRAETISEEFARILDL